jgi:hypothetical protein
MDEQIRVERRRSKPQARRLAAAGAGHQSEMLPGRKQIQQGQNPVVAYETRRRLKQSRPALVVLELEQRGLNSTKKTNEDRH